MRHLQLVGQRLRALLRVAGKRDDLDAALVELRPQPAEIERVLQADRAIQTETEHHQGEVRCRIARQREEPMGGCRDLQAWDRLSRYQHAAAARLRAPNPSVKLRPPAAAT